MVQPSPKKAKLEETKKLKFGRGGKVPIYGGRGKAPTYLDIPALHYSDDPKERAEEWAEYQRAKALDTPEGWAHYYRDEPVAQEHFAEHYRVRNNDLESFQRYISAVPAEIRDRILAHQISYEGGSPKWVPPIWIP
jgi:hypothetical protein